MVEILNRPPRVSGYVLYARTPSQLLGRACASTPRKGASGHTPGWRYKSVSAAGISSRGTIGSSPCARTDTGARARAVSGAKLRNQVQVESTVISISRSNFETGRFQARVSLYRPSACEEIQQWKSVTAPWPSRNFRLARRGGSFVVVHGAFVVIETRGALNLSVSLS